jgi:hypothetical protein
LYKRSIVKHLDINEPTEEYLLVDDINDMTSFSYTASNPWNLSSTYSTILTDKQGLIIAANGGNLLMCDLNNFTSTYEFVYLSFNQSISDIQSVAVVSGSSDIYIASDNVYSIDINNFTTLSPTTNNISSTYSSTLQYSYYANKILDYNGQQLFFCGNYSTLYYSPYDNLLYDIDSFFNYRYTSKLLFLDYDIASKLNFIDITSQNYKLPASFTSSIVSTAITSLSISNIFGEYNWLNYYKDKEKTFQYYTSLDASNEVLFSTTFSYYTGSYFTFTASSINITYDAIKSLAPNINQPGTSKFIAGTTSISASAYPETIFLYKYLIIIKQNVSYTCNVGDVLYLNSDLVSTTFIINKIFTSGSNKYLYCYTDISQSIIDDLKNFTGIISIDNLNKFSTVGSTASSDLITNFDLHPVSIGYSLTYDTAGTLELSTKYNNKTAYYNMQSSFSIEVTGVGTMGGSMLYDQPFLSFGYKPTYNLYDYLNNINASAFITSKVFTVMPTYSSLTGNDVNNFTASNIYIDTNV